MAEIITLPNGLRVCYERKDSLSCAFGVFVDAGSRNESPEMNGIAHFIEHMTFKGTQTRSAFDVADETDMMGANCNAYTSKTATVYYITGLNKFAERYVELLGDLLFCSTYTEENIEKERGVVLEEIHMYDDDGDSLSSDLLSKIYFGEECSLSRPILGTAKTVKKLKRKDILDFRKKWYRPENIVLSFVGDVEQEVFLTYVEKYFTARIPKETTPFIPYVSDEGKVFSSYAYLKKPYEQASVTMRMPSEGYVGQNYYAPFLLANMLGGGMSSRLFQKVREEMGLVYEVYASNVMRKGGGNFDIFFATSPKNARRAVEAIGEITADVLKNGFTEVELIKTRNQYETSMVLSDESAFDRMRAIGKELLLKGVVTPTKTQIEKMLSISLDEVKETAKAVLGGGNVSIAYVGKSPEEDLLRTYSSYLGR